MFRINSLTGLFKSSKNRKAEKPGQAGEGLFSRVRWHLTLWYGGVLALALILLGFGLYFGVENSLYAPVQSDLDGQARFLTQQWQRQGLARCPFGNSNHPPGQGNPDAGPHPGGEGIGEIRRPVLVYIACYDANGTLLAASDGVTDAASALPTAFLDNGLVKAALNSGNTKKAEDVINGGSQAGPIYRSATPVIMPTGQKVVLQIGRSVADSQAALDSLRNLLIVLGIATLGLASIGGFFLAQRALLPTRQAFTRQQTFIADASHELRTPLTILRTDAEVLLRGRERLDPDDAELLEDIVIETDRLTVLATNLLELARLDAGQLYIEQEVFDLGGLTGDVIQRLKTLAETKGVSLKLESRDKVLILADSQLLEQVILILLDNAVKYTPRGGAVTASVGMINNQPFLKVQDTGIGIAPEHLPNLGKRFYRVDKARARETGGSGLGLSLAFSIVKAHTGTLELTSRPGQGTTATLSLPAFRLIQLAGEPAKTLN
jgi:signal transduction histidine kinase